MSRQAKRVLVLDSHVGRGRVRAGLVGSGFDVVMASNFSHFLFTERAALLRYLRAARRNLDHQGLLILDAYGGPESVRRVEDETEHDDFSYIWDQDDFDPINRMATCYIHFTFGDGSALRRIQHDMKK